MVQLKGIYSNGLVKLDKKIAASDPVSVIVTFMDDVSVIEERDAKSFSFEKCRTLLKDLNTNFADTVIEERRSAL